MGSFGRPLPQVKTVSGKQLALSVQHARIDGLEERREAPRRTEDGAVAGSLEIPTGALMALQPQLETAEVSASIVLSHVVYGVDLHATRCTANHQHHHQICQPCVPMLLTLVLLPSQYRGVTDGH